MKGEKQWVYLRVYEEHPLRHRDWVKVVRFPFYGGRDWSQDFLLDHPTVSRLHFVLEKDPSSEDVLLKNLSSTNGMTQQGILIQEIRIRGKIVVMIGGIKVEFYSTNQLNTDETREIDIQELRQREDSLRIQFLKGLREVLLLTFVLMIQQIMQFIPEIRNTDNSFGNKLFLYQSWSLGLSLLVSVFSKMHNDEYQFLSFMKMTYRFMGLYIFYNTIAHFCWRMFGLIHHDQFIHVILEFLLLGLLLRQYCMRLFLSNRNIQLAKKLTAFLSLFVVICSVTYGLYLVNDDSWGENNDKSNIIPPQFIHYSQRFEDWKENELTQALHDLSKSLIP